MKVIVECWFSVTLLNTKREAVGAKVEGKMVGRVHMPSLPDPDKMKIAVPFHLLGEDFNKNFWAQETHPIASIEWRLFGKTYIPVIEPRGGSWAKHVTTPPTGIHAAYDIPEDETPEEALGYIAKEIMDDKDILFEKYGFEILHLKSSVEGGGKTYIENKYSYVP